MRTFRKFLREERGTIAVMSGVLAVASLGALAVGIDSASLYLEKRKAQGAVDLAAIAAARDLPRANAAAMATINDHHLPDVQEVFLTTGSYTADPAVAPANRFVPNGTPVNAVRVELRNRAPLYFGRAVAKQGNYEVVTRATAVSSAAAAFSVGSRLLSLNGGVLNGVLSGMLGGNISLTLMDYNALAGYNVDLFRFSDTLATKVSGQAGTYDELIKSKATVGNVIDTLA
ncbi:MAG: TadG family pilus assembly protein [Hyphomicrobium sp.]|nr:TadG family pilus assembly protein [Hyphomicrobium sp.]